MKEILMESVFFGAFISLFSYWIGTRLKNRFKLAIFNPLLVSIIITIVILLLLDVDYDTYYEGAKYISYLLTPATICLAVPVYEQLEILKKNYKAVFAGVVAGLLASMTSVLAFSLLFGLGHAEYVTFLPKSITTAIGMGVSEELGGYVPITAATIIITGVVGNMVAEGVCRVFRITEPIAKGIGIGSSAHAVGTTRAMQMGEIEGAMSSLSIVVTGILTCFAAGIFASML